LLDELAHEFTAQKFDLQALARGIMGSRAYQLSSRGGVPASPPLFERMAVRLMTAEQLFESLARATGNPLSNRQRTTFLARFPRTESRVNAPSGIPQALALMNGPLARLMTDPEQSPTLAAVAEAPYLDAAGKVEALFLATLSRPPRPAEVKPFSAHVEKARTTEETVRALSDVFWGLLNSAEFIHNH
jgi:hypothetical protein